MYRKRRRIYTLSPSVNKNKTGYKPCLKMTGSWLKDYGFDINVKVEVLTIDSMLILTVLPDYLDLEEDRKRINKINLIKEKISELNND